MNSHELVGDTHIFYRDKIPLFRKFNSIATMAHTLNKSKFIEYHFTFPNVKLRAASADIIKSGMVHNRHNRMVPHKPDVEFHLPLNRWTVIDGDKDFINTMRESNANT